MDTSEPGRPHALTDADSRGVLWSTQSTDLNVNLVSWPAGEGVGVHTNDALDVLVVVLAGALSITQDGAADVLQAPSTVIIPAGVERALCAEPGGARYLTAHRRRDGALSIIPRPSPLPPSELQGTGRQEDPAGD